MRRHITAIFRRSFAQLAIGIATASFAMLGVAHADNDAISNTSKVPLVGNLVTCSAVTPPVGSSWVPSAFSFDISWIDPFVRAYFLADRSHGGTGGTAGGDVLMIDINAVALTGVNASNTGVSYMVPPADDPMAGIACDQNTAFGGTTGVGRNEITGPNGAFTVNHAEVWVGDGPSQFQPKQGNGTPVMSSPGACGVAGVTCTYPGLPTDYAADPCNSSVRVFDIATKQQTDHINVGGCFRTDEGAFDPVDQIALFANPSETTISSPNFKPLNKSPFITLISTVPQPFNPTLAAPQNAHEILKQINFDGTEGTVNANGGIEQAVYSRKTGMFYIVVPGNSAAPANGFVAVVDPHDATNIHVVTNFKVTNCSPNGAALGPDFELYLGCSGGPTQVMDIRNGHVIKVVAGTTGGCDEVAFNEGDNHFLGACTDSNAATSDDNLDFIDAGTQVLDQAINTFTKGAHSVAADFVTVSNWVPAAAGTGASAPPAQPGTGLCGPTPCILIFKSLGQDDPARLASAAKADE